MEKALLCGQTPSVGLWSGFWEGSGWWWVGGEGGGVSRDFGGDVVE